MKPLNVCDSFSPRKCHLGGENETGGIYHQRGRRAFEQPFGVALIGALVNRTKLAERVDSTILPGSQEPKIPHGDIVKSMVGLLCMGKPDYDAIEAFRYVPCFGSSLGIGHCPASPTLRQRLDVVKGAFDQIGKIDS